MNKQISEGMKKHWKAKRESSPDLLWQEIVTSQKAHIADLQREIKRLENLVQVLSDDKFFKPQIATRPAPEFETEMPFQTSDFAFQPETPVIGEPVEDLDIAAELESLTKSYSEGRSGTS